MERQQETEQATDFVADHPVLTSKLVHLVALRPHRQFSGHIGTKAVNEQGRATQAAFIENARRVQAVDDALRSFLIDTGDESLIAEYNHWDVSGDVPCTGSFSDDELDYIESQIEQDPFFRFAYENLVLPGDRVRIVVAMGDVALQNTEETQMADVSTGDRL